jgi:hypothetical protein
MTEFKKKVQSIIEDYCEGINHLEFSIDNFPEMLDRIETEALRIHDVVGQSEQLPQMHGLIKCECGKVYDVDVEKVCPSCGN